ncbi:unnamed protein product [Sphagnum jensenii]
MDGEVFKYKLDLQLLFAIQLTGNNAEGANVTFCISTESCFLSSELHWAWQTRYKLAASLEGQLFFQTFGLVSLEIKSLEGSASDWKLKEKLRSGTKMQWLELCSSEKQGPLMSAIVVDKSVDILCGMQIATMEAPVFEMN